MVRRDFVKVKDTGEGSFWLKRHGPDPLETTLVSVYSDNF